MKSTLSMAAAILVSAVMIGCDNNSDEPVTMKTQADSVSYMFGYQLGGQFAKTKIEVSQEMLKINLSLNKFSSKGFVILI